MKLGNGCCFYRPSAIRVLCGNFCTLVLAREGMCLVTRISVTLRVNLDSPSSTRRPSGLVRLDCPLFSSRWALVGLIQQFYRRPHKISLFPFFFLSDTVNYLHLQYSNSICYLKGRNIKSSLNQYWSHQSHKNHNDGIYI